MTRCRSRSCRTSARISQSHTSRPLGRAARFGCRAARRQHGLSAGSFREDGWAPGSAHGSSCWTRSRGVFSSSRVFLVPDDRIAPEIWTSWRRQRDPGPAGAVRALRLSVFGRTTLNGQTTPFGPATDRSLSRPGASGYFLSWLRTPRWSSAEVGVGRDRGPRDSGRPASLHRARRSTRTPVRRPRSSRNGIDAAQQCLGDEAMNATSSRPTTTAAGRAMKPLIRASPARSSTPHGRGDVRH